MMTMFADMEINFFFSSETTRNPSHKLYLAKHQVAIKCRLICECWLKRFGLEKQPYSHEKGMFKGVWVYQL